MSPLIAGILVLPSSQRILQRVRIAASSLAIAAGLLAAGPLAGPGRDAAAETAAATVHEYDLKAVFLLNFSHFAVWPGDAFASADAPFVIAVLGADPFGPSLDAITAGETVNGHPVVVRRIATVEDGSPCHILFVSASEHDRWSAVAKYLGRRSVLAVGESREFAQFPGAVGFLMAGHRLKLAINPEAAAAARITISSQLLRQAQIVKPAPRKS